MIDKDIFGYLSIFFVILSFIPYIYSILIGQTKPHIFTYILWGLMSLIGAAAQYASEAGPGAWATFASAILCLGIVPLCLSHGEKHITQSDWYALGLGLTALPLWYVTNSPLSAVLVVTLVDGIAYYPTFRKSYGKPKEEMALSYAISNLKHITSVFAMTSYTLTTLLYPASMFALNAALIFMLVWRRRVPVQENVPL